MTWALTQKLKAPDKLALLLLAYRTNPDTEIADATLERLATECGMSRSGLKVVIQRLVDAGLVEVEIRKVEGGKNLPNRYRLTFADRGHDVTPIKSQSQDRGQEVAPEGSGGDPNRGHDVTTKAGSNTEISNKGPKLDFSTWPAEPSPERLAAWLEHRKAKKAKVTDLVMETMGKQLHAAAAIGWTVDDALVEICFRNWQGFKASWLEPKRRNPQHGNAGGSGNNQQVGGNYAQGRQGGNSRAQGGAFNRVADAARSRAGTVADQGAGPDRGDDDGGLW